ncbi:ABC transporter permease subunit [Glycomyces arizonensis]|uniref:ABC transporter permease subunit n=1 Tax=Glycomyces arizonensis TaxID=256035 RepID=UPI0004152E04|nr:ABC transporter permease subunit [Glycomyces arizonensis]
MTTLTDTAAVPFHRTLRAEWIKFRTLRSTWYTLAGLFVLGIGIAALAMDPAAASYRDATAAERLDWDPTALSLRAFMLAQLVVGVLGILVVTSEYATGMMRTSLAATPRRHRLLAAKAVLIAGVALVVGQVLMFAAFFVGQALLASYDVPNASLGDPGVLSAVAGSGLYLTAIALLAAGLGVILRATAGALAILVAVIFLVPAFAELFPSWTQGLLDYWPTVTGTAVTATVADPDFPHPWFNVGGMCLGIAAVLVAAFVLFRRRDV